MTIEQMASIILGMAISLGIFIFIALFVWLYVSFWDDISYYFYKTKCMEKKMKYFAEWCNRNYGLLLFIWIVLLFANILTK